MPTQPTRRESVQPQPSGREPATPGPALPHPSSAENSRPGPERRTNGSGTGIDARVVAAAAVTVTLWASAFIAIRGAGRSYDAGSLALLRMVIGAAGLGVYAAWRGIVWPPRRDLPLVIGWGVAWFCGYNLALNTAEQLIDAGTAAMVVNLAPLMVVALAGVLLHEGFPRGLVIGAPVAFLGVVLIGLQSHGSVGFTGLLLALVAAVLYAGCTLLQKRLLATVDSATLTFVGAASGAVALLPWAGRLWSDLRTAPLAATAQVVYLGVFPTAIAFTTWAYVLTRVSAGKTSATTYVVPALALLMAWAVLGEAPTAIQLLGGALCLLGVFLTQRRPRSGRP